MTETVDSYIAAFPADVQAVLQQVRATIREVVPDADEAISYAIPTFKLGGKNLVHFAGYRHHVGVYPLPAGDEAFARDIAPHVAGKGTARFPHGEPLPTDLIARQVRFLLAERQPT